MSRLLNKTYNVSSTPLISVRLLPIGCPYSPFPTPPPPTSPASVRRWQPPATSWRCTAGDYRTRRPDVGCNASTAGSWTSPSNWTASPQPKNEERLVSQTALKSRTRDSPLHLKPRQNVRPLRSCWPARRWRRLQHVLTVCLNARPPDIACTTSIKV